jgi:HEAT repeat protein
MSKGKTWVQVAVDAVRARLVTLAVWAAIIVVIFATVSYNRAQDAAIAARLSSADQNVRDAVVLELANQNKLIDALTDTEDPNSDSSSPQNKASAVIRENAAASLNRLIAAKKIADSPALNNEFLMRKDADTAVQKTATAGIAALASANRGNMDDVVSRLSDGDPDIRSAAVDALALIGGEPVALKVMPLIKQDASHDSVVSLVTKIGKPAVPLVLPLLSDKDLTFREEMLGILGQIADSSSIPALIGQATQPNVDAPVRRLAVTDLADTVLNTIPAPGMPAPKTPPSPAAIALAHSAGPVLVAALNNGADDSEARSQSALALGRIASPQAISALVNALSDLDNHVQTAALNGIQAVGEPAVGALANILSSKNDIVRVAAAGALGGIGASDALAVLGPALHDPSDDVRRAAAEGLGRSANPAAVPLLISFLSDSNGFVAGEAANSLHLLGAPAIGPLTAQLASSNNTTAYYASLALNDIGSDAVPSLLQSAKSSVAGQRAWSAVTLGQIHDSRAVPVLQTLTKDTNPSARWAASQALLLFGASA